MDYVYVYGLDLVMNRYHHTRQDNIIQLLTRKYISLVESGHEIESYIACYTVLVL